MKLKIYCPLNRRNFYNILLVKIECEAEGWLRDLDKFKVDDHADEPTDLSNTRLIQMFPKLLKSIESVYEVIFKFVFSLDS